MISTKILYMVQDEREIPYMYNIQDAAVCVGGKEIRVMFPGGMKIFVEKQTSQMTGWEAALENQNQQIAVLTKRLDELTSKEVKKDEPKRNGTKNSF